MRAAAAGGSHCGAPSQQVSTLRWQRSAVGSFAGFVDLNDDGTYFGTTSGTLTIGVTTAAMNGTSSPGRTT